jgi:hypothetical protein
MNIYEYICLVFYITFELIKYSIAYKYKKIELSNYLFLNVLDFC